LISIKLLIKRKQFEQVRKVIKKLGFTNAMSFYFHVEGRDRILKLSPAPLSLSLVFIHSSYLNLSLNTS